MKLYITLDYELFLGPKTGTVDNCLVRPMKDLMTILDKTNTKISIMVDGAYLYRMFQLKDSSPEINTDFHAVIDNLKDIYRHGHSLQYHFHPQWLYSNYKEGVGWCMDFNHYKLSDIPKELLRVAFKTGCELIKEISGESPCAFRAGGFTLCTYDFYGVLFKDNGIKIDTSVVMEGKVFSKFQVFDYSSAPQKALYHFRDDVCKEIPPTDDSFIEMPISFGPRITSIQYLWKKYMMLKKYRPTIIYGDGVGVGAKLNKVQRMSGMITKFFGWIRMGAGIDNFGSYSLWELYQYNKKRGVENMVFIGHPKLASDISLHNVEKFISDMKAEGNEFRTLNNVIEC